MIQSPLTTVRSGRFKVVELVANPPSEFGTATAEEVNVAVTKHLKFNDTRNALLLGAQWLADLTPRTS